MKYKLNLDESNYLISFVHTGTNEDTVEINPENMDLYNLNCYHVVNGKVILDEEKYKTRMDAKEVQEKISRMKAELAATDYQIIKCSECQLLGQDMPYDVAALHEQRQAIRDKINGLEG